MTMQIQRPKQINLVPKLGQNYKTVQYINLKKVTSELELHVENGRQCEKL